MLLQSRLTITVSVRVRRSRIIAGILFKAISSDSTTACALTIFPKVKSQKSADPCSLARPGLSAVLWADCLASVVLLLVTQHRLNMDRAWDNYSAGR